MFKKIIFFVASLLIFISISFVSYQYNYNTEDIKQEFDCFEMKFQLAEWEFLKTRDPFTNQLPTNIKSKERIFISKIDALNNLKTDKINSSLWENLGPYNVAGRIKEVEFDIQNPNNLLVASASGGVWYSTNRGSSWFKSYKADFEQSIYCLEQDVREGKTNVWYCGTGELLSTTDRKFSNRARTIGLGDGIYKSTDNGLSWFKLESTSIYNHTNISEPFQMIWDIKIDKFNLNDDIVYAACYGSILRSSNGGQSWNIILGAESNTSFSTDIEITNSGIFYAALASYIPNNKKPQVTGIWRSFDGINWSDITPDNFPDDTRIIKIKSSKSNPNIIYVLTESPRKSSEPFFDFATSYHSFWKYTYNPEEKNGIWEDRTNNLPLQNNENINQTLRSGINSLGGYCIDLAVSPDNENLVYIAGTNLFYSDNAFETSSFKKIGGYQSRLHPDIHYINFSPDNSNEIFVATDGGVYYTNNKSASPVDWIELTNGLVTSQIYSLDVPQNLNNLAIVAGLQDQGSIFTNENYNGYTRVLGGDGLNCYISNNAEFLLVTSYNSYIVGKKLTNFNTISSRILVTDEIIEKTSNFFTIFTVEPSNENELYLAVNNSIYRLDNLKEVINNTKSPLIWNEIKIPFLNTESKISFIKAVSNPENRLYCGTSDGKVFIVDDANTNPAITDITSEIFPQNAFVSCIAVDEDNFNHLLLSFSNYNVQSIFQSNDGGATWLFAGGNLEENPDGTGAGPSIRWVEIINNENQNMYFTGTSSGLYYTTNLAGVNTNWIKISSDLIGNIRIDQIKYRAKDNALLIATQGNGIYYTNNMTKIDVKEYNSNNHLTVFPNPSSKYINIKINIVNKGNYQLLLYDINGKSLFVSNHYFNFGKHYIKLDLVEYPSGVYFIKLIGSNFVNVRKVIKK